MPVALFGGGDGAACSFEKKNALFKNLRKNEGADICPLIFT